MLVSGSRQGRTAAADLAAGDRPDAGAQPGGLRGPRRACIRGATDVTGLRRCSATASRWRARPASGSSFDAESLPALPGALDLARDGVETGGAAHNRRFVADALDVAPGVDPELVTLAHDPQTSGGLLAAIPADRLASVRRGLDEAGVEHWRVGRVEAGGGIVLA